MALVEQTTERFAEAMQETDVAMLQAGNPDGVVVAFGQNAIIINGIAIKRKQPDDPGIADKQHEIMVRSLHNIRMRVADTNARLATVGVAVRNVSLPTRHEIHRHGDTAADATVFALSSQVKHNVLGRVAIFLESWANDIVYGEPFSTTNAKEFPTAVRWEKNSANPIWYVETGRKFNVVFHLKRLEVFQRGLVTNVDELIAAANELSETSHARELRFELSLIYSNGKGRGDPAEIPVASNDSTTSQFKPGKCISFDSEGKQFTNLFTQFNPSNPKDYYSSSCNNGKVVFTDVCFRFDALSSNCKVNDGSFRFLVRCEHGALRSLVNWSRLSPPFKVVARPRASAIPTTV